MCLIKTLGRSYIQIVSELLFLPDQERRFMVSVTDQQGGNVYFI